jgi:hypothetical protein
MLNRLRKSLSFYKWANGLKWGLAFTDMDMLVKEKLFRAVK